MHDARKQKATEASLGPLRRVGSQVRNGKRREEQRLWRTRPRVPGVAQYALGRWLNGNLVNPVRARSAHVGSYLQFVRFVHDGGPHALRPLVTYLAQREPAFAHRGSEQSPAPGLALRPQGDAIPALGELLLGVNPYLRAQVVAGKPHRSGTGVAHRLVHRALEGNEGLAPLVGKPPRRNCLHVRQSVRHIFGYSSPRRLEPGVRKRRTRLRYRHSRQGQSNRQDMHRDPSMHASGDHPAVEFPKSQLTAGKAPPAGHSHMGATRPTQGSEKPGFGRRA